MMTNTAIINPIINTPVKIQCRCFWSLISCFNSRFSAFFLLFALNTFLSYLEIYNRTHGFPFSQAFFISTPFLFLHWPVLWLYVKSLTDQNLVDLLQKQIGIFVCCMFFDKADEQINRGFPQVLRNHARSIKHLGGEFRFEEMNFIERFMVRKIAGANGSISSVKYDKIEEFVRELSAR